MKRTPAFPSWPLVLLLLAALCLPACNNAVEDIRGAETADSSSAGLLQQIGLGSDADSSATPDSTAAGRRQAVPDSTQADTARAGRGRAAGDSLRAEGASASRDG